MTYVYALYKILYIVGGHENDGFIQNVQIIQNRKICSKTITIATVPQ